MKILDILRKKGVFIDSRILASTALTKKEMMLLGLIHTIIINTEECVFSDEELAEGFGRTTPKKVAKIISSLCKKGWLSEGTNTHNFRVLLVHLP